MDAERSIYDVIQLDQAVQVALDFAMATNSDSDPDNDTLVIVVRRPRVRRRGAPGRRAPRQEGHPRLRQGLQLQRRRGGTTRRSRTSPTTSTPTGTATRTIRIRPTSSSSTSAPTRTTTRTGSRTPSPRTRASSSTASSWPTRTTRRGERLPGRRRRRERRDGGDRRRRPSTPFATSRSRPTARAPRSSRASRTTPRSSSILIDVEAIDLTRSTSSPRVARALFSRGARASTLSSSSPPGPRSRRLPSPGPSSRARQRPGLEYSDALSARGKRVRLRGYAIVAVPRPAAGRDASRCSTTWTRSRCRRRRGVLWRPGSRCRDPGPAHRGGHPPWLS